MRVFFISFLLICSGCSVLKAGSAPDSGFLKHGSLLTEMRDRAPFNGLWYSDKKKFMRLWSQYDSIIIAPIELTFLRKSLKSKKLPESYINERLEEVAEVARYLKQRFETRITEYNLHPLKVVTSPTDKTFLLEIALVEAEPADPILNSLGTVAGFFVVGGGALSYIHTSTIAMEGRISDVKTGEIFSEFRDREKSKTSPFTIKDFQRYAHIREAIDDWAIQFSELSATPLDHQVEDSLPVSINPL